MPSGNVPSHTPFPYLQWDNASLRTTHRQPTTARSWHAYMPRGLAPPQRNKACITVPIILVSSCKPTFFGPIPCSHKFDWREHWKVKPHCDSSPFGPLSFPIHDPSSNFQIPSSLGCMKTQTSRCKSLLLRLHLCKHFFIHRLHAPKPHFLNAHTHTLVNTYTTRFLCH